MISKKELKEDVETIKNCLDEHLSSINENTSEIQSLFEYLQSVESKLEKLNKRLDALQLSNETPLKIEIKPLNHLEKKIFLVLYTEETPLSYQEISLKSQIPLAIVSDTLSNLSNKGIPLQRKMFNNQIFLKLEPNFKEIQAKENLINLSLDSFM
jgi:predicted nuclease with TOPRIM domain